MIDILGWFWTSAILVIAVALVLLLIGIYNTLVRLRQNVHQGRADIDAQLRQRHDLIPNLVETVKGYAGHEATTLEAVIQARNVAAKGNPDSRSEQGLKIINIPFFAGQCSQQLSDGHPPSRAHGFYASKHFCGFLDFSYICVLCDRGL